MKTMCRAYVWLTIKYHDKIDVYVQQLATLVYRHMLNHVNSLFSSSLAYRR
jgi:hypothetical protein